MAILVKVPLTGSKLCAPCPLSVHHIGWDPSWSMAFIFSGRSGYTGIKTHQITAPRHCILLLEERWCCCLLCRSYSLDSNEAIDIFWKAKEQSKERKVFLISFLSSCFILWKYKETLYKQNQPTWQFPLKGSDTIRPAENRPKNDHPFT